jgi:putative nucleotidyltransferase with HDIG domain
MRARAGTWLRAVGFAETPPIDAEAEELFETRPERELSAPERRERRAAVVQTAATLAAIASLVALGPDRTFDVGPAVVSMLLLAVLARIRFHDGVGYTAPVQLAFVPTVLLLPPAIAVAVAALAMPLAQLDRVVRGQKHPARLAICLGDAWFAVGPAIVLAVAGPAEPAWSAWPIYLLALVAQFAFDLLASVLHDWYAVGVSADLGLRVLGWTWLVDALLSSVGFLAALAARDQPYAAVLVLPLAVLLAIFSRERTARIEQSLELSSAYRGTTLLLSDVLDEDDEYTAFHSRGVVQLSIAVAEHMGLDARQLRNVEFGALLHDIGKIAIPKEILNKPGKLSPDEWVVMETHTVEGQKMLDKVGGVLREVGQIVRSSHERWDGGGYPDGLAGDDIPLESTIVSACDAFSAMTTHRPYRRALSLPEAIDELRVNAGTQFGPAVVEALVALVEQDAELVGPAAPEPKRAEPDEMTLLPPAPESVTTTES